MALFFFPTYHCFLPFSVRGILEEITEKNKCTWGILGSHNGVEYSRLLNHDTFFIGHQRRMFRSTVMSQFSGPEHFYKDVCTYVFT